jgi:uncharacterized RDD family membrane protein YckC
VSGAEARLDYAGFWRRAGAVVIDLVLLASLILLLRLILYGAGEPGGEAAVQRAQVWTELALGHVLPFVLAVFFWVRFLGTPGKLLLGCQVLDARTQQRIGVGQATLRYLGYLLSALPLMLGFLWIAWDPRKQGFHDKLAGTVVVVEDESQRPLSDIMEETR